MATSFAAYASQYLNRQPQHGDSTLSSSSQQPMFFSFTTDDGSRRLFDQADLDDTDDPHLRGSGMVAHDEGGEEDEDPYLRLDEDEGTPRGGMQGGRERERERERQSIPLMGRSPSPESPPGWLAHLAASPRRSPSPSPSSSSSDSSPPAEVFAQPPSIPQTAHSLSLTSSLLPRDGFTRPLDVFSLPDPRHTSRRRRKYHDSPTTALFLTLLSLSLLACLLLLVLPTPRVPKGVPKAAMPYNVLMHTVPLVTVLTVLSAVAAYAHVMLLRVFVRPVMVATEVFVPATLFVSAVWAFVGSFMWDGDQVPTWGETVGLRLFALIPLALSLITGRRLLSLPRHIHTSSSTLTLTTHILLTNPLLLLLSPLLLLLMLLLSIPFVTLIFRLLLIGYATPGAGGGGWEWHVRRWADWAIVATVGVWLWTWGVARGVMRVSCAGVVGAWYFADQTLPPPPPNSTHTIHAALHRALTSSLGSITLSALALTLTHLLSLALFLLTRLPALLLKVPYAPVAAVVVPVYVVPGVGWVVGVVQGWLCGLGGTGGMGGMGGSGMGLVYCGLTGDGFWEGAGRARVLLGGVPSEEIPTPGQGQVRRGGRNANLLKKKRFTSEPPLQLLSISPLTLTLPSALTTYLFTAHTLNAPHEALGAALLAGGVTALVGLFCVGLVKDTADTLFLCYCIDKHGGERRREEVFVAFEYDGSTPTPQLSNPTQQGQQQRTRQGAPRQPEHIVPRSPLHPSHPQQRPHPHPQSRRETLFDADQTQNQNPRGHRPTPLSPSYLDEDSRLPASSNPSRAPQPQPQHPPRREEEEEEDVDELDPFAGNAVFGPRDEEALLEGQGRGRGRRAVAVPVAIAVQSKGKPGVENVRVGSAGSPGSAPLLGGFGRRLGSGGVIGGVIGGGKTQDKEKAKERMLTSAEMNMKSQFLMNMRYGAQSQSQTQSEVESSSVMQQGHVGSPESVGSGHMPGRRQGEREDEDEDEDEMLGPGSDFFR
ncbi:hypothetical protein B0H34DRAFT_781331 [Crassisporium funariophilum]|nr:hypothetical protein B0H34DRAFT_781331 [Crassisporium funariophilum]